MSQERAERAGTGRDETGRGGITTPNHSGRLRGKGAILLEVSHRPVRVRFPPPPIEVARYGDTPCERHPTQLQFAGSGGVLVYKVRLRTQVTVSGHPRLDSAGVGGSGRVRRSRCSRRADDRTRRRFRPGHCCGCPGRRWSRPGRSPRPLPGRRWCHRRRARGPPS